MKLIFAKERTMNQRLMLLFRMFNEENDYIAISQLSRLLKVSERTVRSDITTLNTILKVNGAVIAIKKGYGYILNITDLMLYQNYLALLSQELMSDLNIPDSPQERNRYILKALLNSNTYIKTENLAEQLYVSKVTIANDLKQVKTILQKFNLALIPRPHYGLKVTGKEIDIRRCLSYSMIERNFDNYILGVTEEELNVFNDIAFNELYQTVLRIIHDNQIIFTDFNLKNFIIHIAIVITRVKNEFPLRIDDQLLIAFDDQLPVLEDIFRYIEEKYSVTMNLAERIYLFNHFTSKSTSATSLSENVEEKILQYVADILESIKAIYNFDLTDDRVLFHDLVIHFRSILNSKHYQLSKENPLLNMIKTNYPLAFEISLNAVEKVFTNTVYTITEAEVGYVSLHIGAAIERLFKAIDDPKKMIIVCGSGYGSSRLLEAKLHTTFQSKIKIISCLSYNDYQNESLQNIDIIVSTIPIKHDTIPVILVDLSLMKRDIENISKIIATPKGSSIINVQALFSPDLFFYHPSFSSKEEILIGMADGLKNNGLVNDMFLSLVLEREDLSSTDIDQFLAIPHPLNLSAIATRIAVTILKNPIQWSEETSVIVVFMLAIRKEDGDKIDELYSLFLRLIQNRNLRETLIHCSTFNDFTQLVLK